MEKLRKIVAKNIKYYRKQFKVSQTKLAEHIDVSYETIAKIETCKQFPSFLTISKLIEYFKIEPYMLFIDEKGRKGLFEKDKYVEKVYPLLVKEIISTLRSTKVDDEK